MRGAQAVTPTTHSASVLAALMTVQLGLPVPALGQHAPADTVRVGALNSGRMIIPMIQNPMLPGLENVGPSVEPFLPGVGLDLSRLPAAGTRQVVELEDGDTLELEASVVRKTVAGKAFAMYAFNRQIPGPLIKVAREATIHVRFTNRIDQPTTVHWHGVRLDNRFDGVPGVTQDPVQPGETFDYTIHFPDAGIYWYHPHVREDIQQDLGLYGNMLVRSEREGYYNAVHREEVVVLDDILLEGDELVPFGREAANFVIMGRFGNVLLINGEQTYDLTVKTGELVRFYLTNVSNTRTFNLSFGGALIKLVGADIGKFEREIMVPGVAIAPAQRYVIEVLFEQPGEHVITNRIRAVNHMAGRFFSAVDTLGVVRVTEEPASPVYADDFRDLKIDEAVQREVESYRQYVDAPVNRELLLSVEVRDLPIQVMQFIAIDTVYRSPVEFTDVMSHMNWLSTSKEVRWILRDAETGTENMDIDWRFGVGDVVKIRLRNDPRAFHPMNHPIHLHGQRFLILSRDGVPNGNLAWKDTALLPVGATVDILLEVTNPGSWMLHCHIAEHLEAGMMMAFEVEPDG
jgi:FtsP/CotA-like multicopper oxidase with cupredoxin domain